MSIPLIKIPKAANEKEVAIISKGDFGDFKKRFERIDQILYGILVTVVLALAAIIISTIGIFLDQMRYNNAAYKDYTEKLNTTLINNNLNQTLLNQIKENQVQILNLQTAVLRLTSTATQAQNSSE